MARAVRLRCRRRWDPRATRWLSPCTGCRAWAGARLQAADADAFGPEMLAAMARVPTWRAALDAAAPPLAELLAAPGAFDAGALRRSAILGRWLPGRPRRPPPPGVGSCSAPDRPIAMRMRCVRRGGPRMGPDCRMAMAQHDTAHVCAGKRVPPRPDAPLGRSSACLESSGGRSSGQHSSARPWPSEFTPATTPFQIVAVDLASMPPCCSPSVQPFAWQVSHCVQYEMSSLCTSWRSSCRLQQIAHDHDVS